MDNGRPRWVIRPERGRPERGDDHRAPAGRASPRLSDDPLVTGAHRCVRSFSPHMHARLYARSAVSTDRRRAPMHDLVLAGITIFPLKSGAGIDLHARDVEPCGLRGDHRWMAVDADGVCVTARERPQLVRVRARITSDGLRLEMEGRAPLGVRYPDPGSRAARVRIWGQACGALDAGDAAAHWISDAIDKPVRLVAMDERFKRRTDPDRTLPEDEVSFADCYPVLAIGQRSLDDLDTRTPAPVSMRRFRPNFVIGGGAPYGEDDWRRVRVGSVEFEGVENCERCELPTVDPETGIPDPRREPMRTLARYRRRAPPAACSSASIWCHAVRARSGSETGSWCWNPRRPGRRADHRMQGGHRALSDSRQLPEEAVPWWNCGAISTFRASGRGDFRSLFRLAGIAAPERSQPGEAPLPPGEGFGVRGGWDGAWGDGLFAAQAGCVLECLKMSGRIGNRGKSEISRPHPRPLSRGERGEMRGLRPGL